MIDAVIALLVEEGYAGVSVRKVASRAGVSIGAVQHHYPTKDAMLNAAMDAVSAEFQARLAHQIAPDATAAEALRQLIVMLVAAEPDERVGSVLWLQRVARAAVDPAVAVVHAREWAELAGSITELVHATRPERGRSWAETQGALLLALADGLATAVAVEPDRMTGARAIELIDLALDRTLAT